jgi:hypothetical protein
MFFKEIVTYWIPQPETSHFSAGYPSLSSAAISLDPMHARKEKFFS